MTISAEQIARVRAFNRDYTCRIGVLSEGLLDSPYSLTEVRVMYEIAHREGLTAADLADDLNLDRGYLSRLLKGFESKKLLVRTASSEDGRRRLLRLTLAGMRAFEPLERRSQKQVGEMLTALDEEHRYAVLGAMEVIQNAFAGSQSGAVAKAAIAMKAAGAAREPTVLKALPSSDAASPNAAPSEKVRTPKPAAGAELIFRTHRVGDMGWVVQRHGELYHQEYGWNEEFEALVAEIVAEFVRKLDPTRERCWIAERNGCRLGCIFLVAKDASTAKLRLLLVERAARGFGVGRELVTECVRFAREAGYRRIVLWTQRNLDAARHLYSDAGFKRTAEEPHHSFGQHLVGETWELELCRSSESPHPD